MTIMHSFLPARGPHYTDAECECKRNDIIILKASKSQTLYARILYYVNITFNRMLRIFRQQIPSTRKLVAVLLPFPI